MDLFVVRHAIAIPAQEGMSDESRPLSEEGRSRFARCVRGMRRLGLRFDRLLHSPYLRALESAEALSTLVQPDGVTAVSAHLAGPPGPSLLEELANGGERIAIVGHEPWLSELMAHLMGSLGPSVELKKGAVGHLRGELGKGGMDLVALLPPRVLVRVGH